MNPHPQSPAAPASPLRSDTMFSELVPLALKSLVDRYGTALLGDAGRLRGLLADEVPQAKKEISVLLLALEERVPQDLMRVHSGEPISSLQPRLTRRLTDEKALAPDAARWAVHAWAQGLGVDSVLTPQPAQVDIGLSAQEGREGAGFAGPHSAANQQFTTPAAQPVPAPPALWDDRRVRIGAGVLAAGLLAVAGWWFTVPQLDIASVQTEGPFVGNGRPVPVFIDYAARNVQLRSAEVRWVKGDGNWGATSWKVDLAPDGSGATRVAAGTLQVATPKPISATFEYVLVAADGKRSTPYLRTFDVLPPLVITKVQVPRSTLVGKEFAIDITFQKSSAEIVRVERKVIDSTQAWAQTEHALPVKLAADATGFAYRFDPFPKPTRATLELTLVDAAGLKSDPVRVTLNIGMPAPVQPGSGPGEVLAVRKTPGKATSNDWMTTATTAVGALFGYVAGKNVGGGSGRTAATIVGTAGGAWAGYEVGQRLAGGNDPDALYETTVRFDDGHTRTITTRGTPPWGVGARVVWDGRVLSPGAPRAR